MRQEHKKKTSAVQRMVQVSWWKLIAGGILIGIGIMFGVIYFNDAHNLVAGYVTVLAMASGGLLAYLSLQRGSIGYSFAGTTKYKGDENTILILARRDPLTNHDVPIGIRFFKMRDEKIPAGARPHLLRNLGKHFYVLYNNNDVHKLLPAVLPDKKSFPPELYKIPATMQPYKDYMDFSPVTMLQKVAPGILLGAMGLVGLLMLVTGG